MVVFIKSAFAVNAVERAHLAIFWHEVDAQRDAESAAVNRAEDGRRVDNALVSFIFRITVHILLVFSLCSK